MGNFGGIGLIAQAIGQVAHLVLQTLGNYGGIGT